MSGKMKIRTGWRTATLQDLVFFQRGYDITKAEQKPGDIPVVSSSGINSYHSEYKVDGPGVVVGRKGSLGTVHYVDGPYWPHDTTLWSKDLKGNNARFVYYFLRTMNFERYNVGNANPTLNRNHIHGLEILIPDLVIQNKIASMLSTYDDLVENNQRRIELLEQAARLLYREWFVHLRFPPGHEHVRIVDGVPEGWEKKPLSEVADIIMGQSPKSIYYNEEGNGLPFHQGVTNFGIRFPSHQTYCTVINRLAEPGDILFSVRAPVGRINITPDKIVIGRGIAAIRSNCGQQNFLFYALKSHFFKEDMMGGGAIFAAITKKDLHRVEILQATDRIAEMFIEHTRAIDLQIENLQQAIDDLTQARDLLLPRLMNGEIAV
ncbi:restriction endonuclease subunit S [Methanogenium cariaci]|uniref:restriction endonuclease subunit S n=1 Tax=Methanogenium cariaci TaxID=2197 RepID=UPI0009FA1252|nr:restriction endonuclease subunit S [Methanogenium cariaci]